MPIVAWMLISLWAAPAPLHGDAVPTCSPSASTVDGVGRSTTPPSAQGRTAANESAPQAAPAEPDDADHRLTRPPPGAVASLEERAAVTFSDKLADAQLAHLLRVAVWGSANVAGGLALMGGTAATTAAGIDSRPELFGVGAQASLWGAINVAIAVGGSFLLDGVTQDLTEALDAEDTWRNVLLVNEVLNVGYVLVGAALVVLGLFPVPLAAQLRGHGMGIVLQGAGLLLLDGLALTETLARRDKLDRFRSVPAHQGDGSLVHRVSSAPTVYEE